jgi:hypothetical protein
MSEEYTLEVIEARELLAEENGEDKPARCQFCDPESSHEAMLTLHGMDWVPTYGRYLKNFGSDEWLTCAFPAFEVRTMKAFLDERIQRDWPNSTIIILDEVDDSVYVVESGVKDANEAVERIYPTECCSLYWIGKPSWPWTIVPPVPEEEDPDHPNA